MDGKLKYLIEEHLKAISPITLKLAIESLLDLIYHRPVQLTKPTELQRLTHLFTPAQVPDEIYSVPAIDDAMRTSMNSFSDPNADPSPKAITQNYWKIRKNHREFDPMRAFTVKEMYSGNILTCSFQQKLEEEQFESEEEQHNMGSKQGCDYENFQQEYYVEEPTPMQNDGQQGFNGEEENILAKCAFSDNKGDQECFSDPGKQLNVEHGNEGKENSTNNKTNMDAKSSTLNSTTPLVDLNTIPSNNQSVTLNPDYESSSEQKDLSDAINSQIQSLKSLSVPQEFSPSKPSNFLPDGGKFAQSQTSDADFLQMPSNTSNNDQDQNQELLSHVQYINNELLNKTYNLELNDRLTTPLLAKYVRKLCAGQQLPEVLTYLSSNMNIPVYYSVYQEYAGFLQFQDIKNDVVALADRYIIVEANFNDDGQFGQVMLCYDVIEKCYVAIKKCKSPEYFGQLLNEVRTLLYVNCHDRVNNYRNFCHMKDYFIQFSTLFIVFEFLGDNLYQYSCKCLSQRKQIFSIQQLKDITRNLLSSICFLESIGILHFDCKPENIVIQQEFAELQQNYQIRRKAPAELQEFKQLGQLQSYSTTVSSIQPFEEQSLSLDQKLSTKLIDIGSHQFFEQNIVPYVQSRFYRAPEVFLKIPYDGRTESFSIGCLLYELLTGKPLFVTNVENQCYAHQLASFVGLLGPLPEWMILAGMDSHKYVTEQYEIYCEKDLLLNSYFEEFGNQTLDDLEAIPGKYVILEPIQQDLRELLEFKIKDIYECDELDQDMKSLVDFIVGCLKINMHERKYPEQLLEMDFIK